MTWPGGGAHAGPLAELRLDDRATARLGAYLDTLARWSGRVNLTAARTARERVAILVAPVAPLAAGLPAGRLLDVGSGNGSPGLVLGALRADLLVTLLEPRARRWAFLREAARAAGATNVTAIRVRHEQYDAPPADILTVRALRLPAAAIPRLLRPGGLYVCFGAPPQPPDGLERDATRCREAVYVARLLGAGRQRST